MRHPCRDHGQEGAGDPLLKLGGQQQPLPGCIQHQVCGEQTAEARHCPGVGMHKKGGSAGPVGAVERYAGRLPHQERSPPGQAHGCDQDGGNARKEGSGVR